MGRNIYNVQRISSVFFFLFFFFYFVFQLSLKQAPEKSGIIFTNIYAARYYNAIFTFAPPLGLIAVRQQ